MSQDALFTEAATLVRAGEFSQAVDLLQRALPRLGRADKLNARRYIGLAHHFAQAWTEALAQFESVAQETEVPEDHFNEAMARVQLGEIEKAHACWQRVFDLSYAHQDAPETSTFFSKKLMFAQLLRDAGACDARGLDLVERQLMGFFTNYRITDASYWGIRGVPAFQDVLLTTRDYYRAMGRSEAEWMQLCDGIAAQVDEDGAAFCAEVRGSLHAPADPAS